MKRHETHRFYEDLVAARRPTQGLSCGFAERYDPAALQARPELFRQLEVVFARAFAALPASAAGVLDVGCGSFFYRALLEKRFRLVAGLEPVRALIQAGAESEPPGPESRTAFCRAEAERLPFADGSWPCVFSLDVLHHLESPAAMLAEVRRVLEPGGLFVAIEPNLLNPGMFLAHLLPREERGGLRYNWPFRLRSLVGRHLEPQELFYYNLSIAAGVSTTANRLFPFRDAGSPPWGLRLVLTARKPA